MNIKFDLIRRSFYFSFFLLLITVASIFISYPFKNIIVPVLALLLLGLGIFQIVETGRIRKLLIRTSDILSRSTERDFPALKDGEKNIINHKISDLIEQLEDSVKQTEQVLKDKDRLERENGELKDTLETMRRALNRNVIEVKEQMRESSMTVDKILIDLSYIRDACGREREMMDSMVSHYSTYSDNYGRINESISRSRDICDREVRQSRDAEETLTGLYDLNEDSDEQLHTIVKGIENIREVTGIINEVAEKASILSLNAAIESAHAGEAGKGFSVVAEEVGVLADTTAEHADLINEALFSVSDLVRDSKIDEEESDDSYSRLISMVKKMGGAFAEIKELLGSLSLIKRPEELAIREENLKDRELVDKAVRTLGSLKNDWEKSLEKVGRLTLLEDKPEDDKEKTGKLAIHETAVKTISDEDLSEEVE